MGQTFAKKLKKKAVNLKIKIGENKMKEEEKAELLIPSIQPMPNKDLPDYNGNSSKMLMEEVERQQQYSSVISHPAPGIFHYNKSLISLSIVAFFN